MDIINNINRITHYLDNYNAESIQMFPRQNPAGSRLSPQVPQAFSFALEKYSPLSTRWTDSGASGALQSSSYQE